MHPASMDEKPDLSTTALKVKNKNMEEIQKEWETQDERETHGGDMPTDETMAFLKACEDRKNKIHLHYGSRKIAIREHTKRLRQQIINLEENIQRNNAMLDSINDNEWKEIYL